MPPPNTLGEHIEFYEELRSCSTCGDTKPVTEFAWRNKSSGARRGVCVKCYRGKKAAYITDSQFTTECPRCGWTGKMSSRNQVTISARGHLCPKDAEMRQGVA